MDAVLLLVAPRELHERPLLVAPVGVPEHDGRRLAAAPGRARSATVARRTSAQADRDKGYLASSARPVAGRTGARARARRASGSASPGLARAARRPPRGARRRAARSPRSHPYANASKPSASTSSTLSVAAALAARRRRPRSRADGRRRSTARPGLERVAEALLVDAARARRRPSTHDCARRSRVTLAVDEVHLRRAEERRDEARARALVDLERRALLLDDAAVHDPERVGQRHRLDLVVGHVERGRAEPVVQAADLDAHLGAQRGVEVRERLVEEEDGRPGARWRGPSPRAGAGRRRAAWAAARAARRAPSIALASRMRESISAGAHLAQLAGRTRGCRAPSGAGRARSYWKTIATSRSRGGRLRHVAAGELDACPRRPSRAPRRGAAACSCRSRSVPTSTANAPSGISTSTPRRMGFVAERLLHAADGAADGAAERALALDGRVDRGALGPRRAPP